MKSQNKEDIFTLEKVKGPLFFFVQEENIIYKYNANVLADFIEETGCYKDPQTQIVYNEIELLRLEKITKRSIRGIKKKMKQLMQVQLNRIKAFRKNHKS